MKLIKLQQDHYVIVDDSEIKEGDWMYLQQGNTPSTKQGEIARCEFADANNLGVIWKKITHSTIPLESMNHGNYSSSVYLDIEKLSLQEVKELIGEVDVDKRIYDTDFRGDVNSYKNGYNQSLEDNKEKKYTEEDLKRYHNIMCLHGNKKGEEFIQSLQPKTEWVVEFIDGQLKLKQ